MVEFFQHQRCQNDEINYIMIDYSDNEIVMDQEDESFSQDDSLVNGQQQQQLTTPSLQGQHQSVVDQSFDEQNTTMLARAAYDVSPEIRKQINTIFNKRAEYFASNLFRETSIKTQEISIIKSFLKAIKISEQKIQAELDTEQKAQDNPRQQLIQNCENFVQKRNNIEFERQLLEDHLNQGQPIQLKFYDVHQTPLYLSHNPVRIHVSVQNPRHYSKYLEVIHKFLLSPKLVPAKEIATQYTFRVRTFNSLIFNENFLSVHISDNEKPLHIEFIICASTEEDQIETLRQEVLKVYCDLSREFKSLCAFLNYWAISRGLLDEHTLSEFALYCMIIDFVQSVSHVPNIFCNKYISWKKQKIELANLIHTPTDQRLEQFTFGVDYLTYVKKRVGMIKFLQFPKSGDIDEVKKKWRESRKTQQDDNENKQNLGSLIAYFFRLWSQDQKFWKPLNLSNPVVSKAKEEIGLVIFDPIWKDCVITPQLKKRKKNNEFRSSNMYTRLREELTRASELIKLGKFDLLCQKFK